jgi:hypothetical protein
MADFGPVQWLFGLVCSLISAPLVWFKDENLAGFLTRNRTCALSTDLRTIFPLLKYMEICFD